MGVTLLGYSPYDRSRYQPGGTVELNAAVKVRADYGEFIGELRIYYRIYESTWQYASKLVGSAEWASLTKEVALTPAPMRYEWYVWIFWQDGAGVWHTSTSSPPWYLYVDKDSTPPTLTGVSPAAGNVAPAAGGVVFEATAVDNYSAPTTKLYVDDELVDTWTTAGAKQHSQLLTRGPHTYGWVSTDADSNTTATATVDITVINAAPVVPAGAVSVAGKTSGAQVGHLGNVAVSWPAFLDPNPEDDLTYTLENRAAGGAWAEVATGITGLTYEWSPNIGLGAAELRVKANDGTADSAYLTRTGITIVSSQSPNAPTLTSPLGGESWREGETHNVEWTPAATEHPEGLPCTYEIQFSALGDFSDAVNVTSSADDGAYPWTLSTDLVAR